MENDGSDHPPVFGAGQGAIHSDSFVDNLSRVLERQANSAYTRSAPRYAASSARFRPGAALRSTGGLPKLKYSNFHLIFNPNVSLDIARDSRAIVELSKAAEQSCKEMLERMNRRGQFVVIDPQPGHEHRPVGWNASTIEQFITNYKVEFGAVTGKVHVHMFVGITHRAHIRLQHAEMVDFLSNALNEKNDALTPLPGSLIPDWWSNPAKPETYFQTASRPDGKRKPFLSIAVYRSQRNRPPGAAYNDWLSYMSKEHHAMQQDELSKQAYLETQRRAQRALEKSRRSSSQVQAAQALDAALGEEREAAKVQSSANRMPYNPITRLQLADDDSDGQETELTAIRSRARGVFEQRRLTPSKAKRKQQDSD